MRALLVVLTVISFIAPASAFQPASSQPATPRAPRAHASLPPVRPATPPPTIPQFNETAWRKRNDMIVQRWHGAFVRAYNLESQQANELRKVLDELALRDIEYFKSKQADLQKAQAESVQLAREMVQAQQSKSDPKEIERMRAAQIAARERYLAMQRGGPLTEDAVMTSLDKMLPEPAAKAGRTAYMATKPQFANVPGAPVPPGQTVGDASQTPNPAVTAIRPTLTRKVFIAAPRIERWGNLVERLITERAMEPAQAEMARLILKNVQPRAMDALAKPPKPEPMPARSATVEGMDSEFKEPGHTLDLLFDELMQRVEHSLHFEQQKMDDLTTPRFAPSPDRWDTIVAKTILERRYDKGQSEAARKLLEEYAPKARALQEQSAADLAAAAKTEDAAQRAAACEAIERKQDELYVEFVSKIEKLSRADQIPPKGVKPPEPGVSAKPH